MTASVDHLGLIGKLTTRRMRLLGDSAVLSDNEFASSVETSAVKSNVMCSDLDGEFITWEGDNAHYLILDIDHPVEVYESSTGGGHHHLIIGKPLEFHQMVEILEVLAKHGVVQNTWVESTKDKGYATLRRPGINKYRAEDNYGLTAAGEIETKEQYKKAHEELLERSRVRID